MICQLLPGSEKFPQFPLRLQPPPGLHMEVCHDLNLHVPDWTSLTLHVSSPLLKLLLILLTQTWKWASLHATSCPVSHPVPSTLFCDALPSVPHNPDCAQHLPWHAPLSPTDSHPLPIRLSLKTRFLRKTKPKREDNKAACVAPPHRFH